VRFPARSETEFRGNTFNLLVPRLGLGTRCVRGSASHCRQAEPKRQGRALRAVGFQGRALEPGDKRHRNNAKTQRLTARWSSSTPSRERFRSRAQTPFGHALRRNSVSRFLFSIPSCSLSPEPEALLLPLPPEGGEGRVRGVRTSSVGGTPVRNARNAPGRPAPERSSRKER